MIRAVAIAVVAGLLATGAVVPAGAQAFAGAGAAPVTVAGETITESDAFTFMRGLYGAAHRRESPPLDTVEKSPAAMPPDAPLVSYQGRQPGPPAKQLILITSDSKSTTGRAFELAYLAALVIAVMDNGDAGRTLQSIYARTPSDRASRLALGASFARAFTVLSDRKAARAAGDAAWIKKNVITGTTRAAAYHMLESRGLTAYNSAFVKGRSIPAARPDPRHPLAGATCDMSDQESGAWPTMNQPLPKLTGACAVKHRKPVPNPTAEIYLDGAFNIVCSWSTPVTIAFDRRDRVTAVRVKELAGGCL